MTVLILCSEESVKLRAHANALGACLVIVPIQTLLHLKQDVAFSTIAFRVTTFTEPDELRHALSEREKQVVAELAKGAAYKEIARALGISVRTVESHIRNIKRKLKLVGLRQLMSYAVTQSLSQAQKNQPKLRVTDANWSATHCACALSKAPSS
jgi:DNA-binding CsgD family transcriptional regulator